ncbi:hypothetical protein SAY87_022395 [Trapa incisa]|uniref:THO complex subunit 6 n=2 Tax=Trapa TaxID=22665 RepID=A0AAN7QX76_TRANT|nr:hypothetical protein SAY87_022395 [Trapa incisa]KAK4783319.1 hypothetical protein SAY86_007693 [Trapa natans]
MCFDSRNWNEESYRDSILKARELQTRTVFRAIWAPSSNPNPDTIVVASSDGLISSYSVSSCISKHASGFISSRNHNMLTIKPDSVLRGHDGSVYDVKFYGDGEDTLLLSCGDDGRIRGWKWKDITLSDAPNYSIGNHVQPVIDLVNPQHKGPWGALSPIPENNALAIDVKQGSIYAAAGDSCAYCWDVETGKAKMIFSGHRDYLHCIVLRSSANQIITGSEDGTARIWDCRSARCVHVIAPEKDLKYEKFSSCISCIALDASENWLVCGCGSSLSLWNLPASECISKIPTSAPALDVIFYDNQILEVGAAPVLSRFDMKGNVLSQIHCAPQLSFSISLHHSGVCSSYPSSFCLWNLILFSFSFSSCKFIRISVAICS